MKKIFYIGWSITGLALMIMSIIVGLTGGDINTQLLFLACGLIAYANGKLSLLIGKE